MTLYSYLIILHYIFSYLWVENRIFNKFKQSFICVHIVKCQVKFCLLLDFLHIILFLTNLASTDGPHEISRRAHAAPGARGGGATGEGKKEKAWKKKKQKKNKT